MSDIDEFVKEAKTFYSLDGKGSIVAKKIAGSACKDIQQALTYIEDLQKNQAMHDDYGNPCKHTKPCNCHCDNADCPYFIGYNNLKDQITQLQERIKELEKE